MAAEFHADVAAVKEIAQSLMAVRHNLNSAAQTLDFLLPLANGDTVSELDSMVKRTRDIEDRARSLYNKIAREAMS